MDPVTASLTLGAASSVSKGISGYQAAKGEQQRAEINSYIGRTRALQNEAVGLEELGAETGSMRNVFAANGDQPSVGTLEVVKELRRVRDRERRIGTNNQRSQANDFSLQARNAGAKATGSLVSGVIGAGPSLFDMYDYKKGKS